MNKAFPEETPVLISQTVISILAGLEIAISDERLSQWIPKNAVQWRKQCFTKMSYAKIITLPG